MSITTVVKFCSRTQTKVLPGQSSGKLTKPILADKIAREMIANRIKCDAFITIYAEKLHVLRNTQTRAPYEDSGDYIHTHPPLENSVYETYKNDLDVLGATLSNDIHAIYATIKSNVDYQNLDKDMPRRDAILAVEKIVDHVQDLMRPMARTLATLQIIGRDSAKRSGD